MIGAWLATTSEGNRDNIETTSDNTMAERVHACHASPQKPVRGCQAGDPKREMGKWAPTIELDLLILVPDFIG
jgi:hypothetical protein